MFILSNFLTALASVLNMLLSVYMWIIIIRALISWVSPDPFNPIVRLLYRVTEPVLRPVRRSLPTYQIGLDLSPLLVIIGLEIVDRYVLPGIAAALLY